MTDAAENAAAETAAASAPDGMNDNVQTADSAGAQPGPTAEEVLEKLYDRLPHIIGRITEKNIHEAEAALRALFDSFRKINALEAAALKKDEQHDPLTLSRIYDMASSGGGGAGTKVKELEEANAAFAVENGILAETVESLTFAAGRMKAAAVDQLLGEGKAKTIPLKALKDSLRDISVVLARVDEQVALLGRTDDQEANINPGGKPLDERLFEALSGSDDISAEMLKVTPGNTTFLGKVLRRAGFAYDYKDIAAVRGLVGAALKANRQLAATNAALAPAREQLERLHGIIGIVELYAGHEERKGPQYAEALKEIDRLHNSIGLYKQKHGELEAVDQAIASKKTEVELQENIIGKKKEEAQSLNKARDEKLQELKARSEQLDAREALLKEAEAANEKGAAVPTPSAASDSGQEDAAQKFAGLREGEIARLTEQNRQEQDRHRSEIAAMGNKMRLTESGLLAEKLEAEIISLREIAAASHDVLEKERETRKAFDSRVEIWVRDEKTLKKDVEKWRRVSGLKFSFTAAACAAAACIGYGAAVLVTRHKILLPAYFAVFTGVSALVGGACRAFYKAGKYGRPKRKDIGQGMLKWGGVGLGIGAAALGWMGLTFDSYAAKAKQDAEADFSNKENVLKAEVSKKEAALKNETLQLLSACRDSPCRVIDGTVHVLSKEFAGEAVTFDFSDAKNPKLIRTTTAPMNPPPPKGK